MSENEYVKDAPSTRLFSLFQMNDIYAGIGANVSPQDNAVSKIFILILNSENIGLNPSKFDGYLS